MPWCTLVPVGVLSPSEDAQRAAWRPHDATEDRTPVRHSCIRIHDGVLTCVNSNFSADFMQGCY
jgi:hypothetical protein